MALWVAVVVGWVVLGWFGEAASSGGDGAGQR